MPTIWFIRPDHGPSDAGHGPPRHAWDLARRRSAPRRPRTLSPLRCRSPSGTGFRDRSKSHRNRRYYLVLYSIVTIEWRAGASWPSGRLWRSGNLSVARLARRIRRRRSVRDDAFRARRAAHQMPARGKSAGCLILPYRERRPHHAPLAAVVLGWSTAMAGIGDPRPQAPSRAVRPNRRAEPGACAAPLSGRLHFPPRPTLAHYTLLNIEAPESPASQPSTIRVVRDSCAPPYRDHRGVRAR